MVVVELEGGDARVFRVGVEEGLAVSAILGDWTWLAMVEIDLVICTILVNAQRVSQNRKAMNEQCH